MREAPILLDIRDLHIHFRIFEGVSKVINGVSLRLRKGETVALVGETGCGKSVTMKAVMGLLPIPPTKIVKGQIFFEGKDLLTLTDEKLREIRGSKISMVFQDPMSALNPVFTIGEQIEDVIRWQGRKKVSLFERLLARFNENENRKVKSKSIGMLDRVGLPSPEIWMKRFPSELSGGMRQRCLIAMALVFNPALLIADEPGTALDVTIQAQILDLLKKLAREQALSVIYITHNLGVAREISQKIYIMYAGEVAEYAKTYELFNNPKHPYTKGLLGSIPKLSKWSGKGIVGRIPNYVNPPKGCRFHPRCDKKSPICKKEAPKLVEVDPQHLVHCHLYH